MISVFAVAFVLPGVERDGGRELEAGGAVVELGGRRRGRGDVVGDAHLHRDVIGSLLGDLRGPGEEPRLAVLRLGERRKDAPEHHQPVVIEIPLAVSIRRAHRILVELLVTGRLVEDGENARAELGKERDLHPVVLEDRAGERLGDDAAGAGAVVLDRVIGLQRVVPVLPVDAGAAHRHGAAVAAPVVQARDAGFIDRRAIDRRVRSVAGRAGRVAAAPVQLRRRSCVAAARSIRARARDQNEEPSR